MRKIYGYLLLFILLTISVSAQDYIITNSQDWKDVLSVEVFGNIQNTNTLFLTGTRHATIIHFSIPNSEIEIISSVDSPWVVGFDSILASRGFDDVTENAYDNVNLELARRLQGITNFIIVDDSYGYNALAVASYASMADYYMLFADERTISDIENYLSDVDVDNIILYGQVDREVKEALAQYNPEIINTGDRFDDNIAIVEKFLQEKPTTQAILTNGEFIEQTIVDGFDPVLFIGNANVPEQIQEYIQNSDIDIGILVGNELIGTATIIRRQVGINVFVKFAQGARSPGGAISAVEDLDRFPMPSVQLDLRIAAISYNEATGYLEVTYRNNADIATYFKSTFNIFSGGQLQVVGDASSIFIDENEFKTILYEVDPFEEDLATAELFVIFGESPKALEFALEGTIEIERVTILDSALINVTDFYYDQGEGAFFIEVINIGETEAFIDVEVLDVWINGQFITIGGDEVISLQPGEKGRIRASVDLADEDIENAQNLEIEVITYYGQRENALIKQIKSTFEFKLKQGDIVTYILILVVVILLFLIIFKRKKKCPNKDCKHKNPRRLDTCEKCGTRL